MLFRVAGRNNSFRPLEVFALASMLRTTGKSRSSLFRYAGFFASVGAARMLGLLLTSITFPLLIRRLGVETYGAWSYVVALCAFFDIVANPGLTSYVTQQVAARRFDASDLVSDFLVLRTLSVALAAVILIAVAMFEPRRDIRFLIEWYGVAALVVSLTGSDFFLGSLELFHLKSALTLIQQALYAITVIILVHSAKDLFWIPLSILASSLLTNLVGWFALWREGFRPAFKISPSRWRSMLVPSLHYAVSSGMSTIYHRTGHLVVRWFLGDYALGLYAAAIRFVDLMRNLVNIALGVLMPRMAVAAQSAAGLRRLVHAAVSALAAVSIPLMFGTLATAHLVVPWLMGSNYLPAVPLVRWISPFMLAGPMASLLSGTVLYAMGHYRAYLISATVGAFTAAALSLILVRLLGLPGACIAFILAEFAVAATAYLLIPSELRDMWKNPVIALAAVCTLLMVAVVRFAGYYSSRPLLIVAIGAVVYMSASFLFGRKLLSQQFGVAQ